MGIAIGVVLLYGLGAIVAIAILIYVIARRIDDRQREDFEKRKN